MKLRVVENVVGGTGFGEAKSFGMKMNAKAFRALTDTLYSDKIGSIVRELSANAYDAHNAAGRGDVPFEIHLPNEFEPYFSIRDYGAGISPEDIDEVYTVLFESTKDHNNDAVGAFGLGSKTPFSYIDSFTVVSINNGVKYTYSAHMDAGIPVIVLINSTETDEHSGLEVNLAVRPTDFHNFHRSTVEQLRYFSVKPVIKNAVVEWDDTTAAVEIDNNVKLLSHNRFGRLVCLQGPVGYDIDTYRVYRWAENNNKPTNVFDDLNIVRGRTIVIDLPIGTLDLIVSREDVSYDDETLENLYNSMREVAQTLRTALVNDLIDTYNTDGLIGLYKAIRAHGNDARYDQRLAAVLPDGVILPKYRTLIHKIDDSVYNTLTDIKITQGGFSYSGRFTSTNVRNSYPRNSAGILDMSGAIREFRFNDALIKYEDADGNVSHYVNLLSFLQGRELVTVIIRDVNTYVARTHEYLYTNCEFNTNPMYVLHMQSKSDSEVDAVVKMLTDMFGDMVQIFKVSDTPAVSTASGSSRTRTSTGRQFFYVSTPNVAMQSLADNTMLYNEAVGDLDDLIDDDKEYLCLNTFRSIIAIDTDVIDVSQFNALLHWWDSDDDRVLIAASSQDAKKFADYENVYMLDDVIDKYRDEYTALATEIIHGAILYNYYRVSASVAYNNIGSLNVLTLIERAYSITFTDVEQYRNLHNKYVSMKDKYEYASDKFTNVHDYDNEMTKFLNSYISSTIESLVTMEKFMDEHNIKYDHKVSTVMKGMRSVENKYTPLRRVLRMNNGWHYTAYTASNIANQPNSVNDMVLHMLEVYYADTVTKVKKAA